MGLAHGFRAPAALAAAVACLVTASPARAGSFFDFEDGTLQGWQTTTKGGIGRIDVSFINGSKIAYFFQPITGAISLSNDFPYDPSGTLSFDMQAQASYSAYSGVRMTFLNALNLPLGSIGFYHASDPSVLPAGSISVDNYLHHYVSLESGFASLVGVNNPAQVSTLSVSFVALGETGFNGPNSIGELFVDNIRVGEVPELSNQALLLAGLAVMVITACRHHSRE